MKRGSRTEDQSFSLGISLYSTMAPLFTHLHSRGLLSDMVNYENVATCKTVNNR